MTSIMVILVVVSIVGLAARYIYKQKKQGVKCIGCPSGCNCSTCGGCSCHGKEF